jgi:hypothetical protein
MERRLPGRFYVETTDSGPPSESIVRAFLWLKRRIEETEQSGLLALPDERALDGALKEALGWRLVEVLKSEGELPLGDGLAMEVTTIDEVRSPSMRPLVALWPPRRYLANLRYWPGLVLLVPSSEQARRHWVEVTNARLPEPENYWPAGAAPAHAATA